MFFFCRYILSTILYLPEIVVSGRRENITRHGRIVGVTWQSADRVLTLFPSFSKVNIRPR